jgi:hypothetical protein
MTFSWTEAGARSSCRLSAVSCQLSALALSAISVRRSAAHLGLQKADSRQLAGCPLPTRGQGAHTRQSNVNRTQGALVMRRYALGLAQFTLFKIRE